jgi:hypothetical protein
MSSRLMVLLLGLDADLLSQCSPAEQRRLWFATLAFAVIIPLMVLGDAYFGFLYEATPVPVIICGLMFGFIHFSIYRLALVTIPLAPLGMPAETTAPISFRRFSFWWKGEVLLRWIFVACIAASVGFPLAALTHHQETMNITEQHKMTLQALDPLLSERQNPNQGYPFFVFQQLSKSSPSFDAVVVIWIALMFLPLFMLFRIRYQGDTYIRLLAEKHQAIVLHQYYSMVQENQAELNRRFPGQVAEYKKSFYEDPPFNRRPKPPLGTRKWATKSELHQYLRSLS